MRPEIIFFNLNQFLENKFFYFYYIKRGYIVNPQMRMVNGFFGNSLRQLVSQLCYSLYAHSVLWNNVAVVGIVIWYILDDDADDAIIKPDICHSDHNQKWIQINLVQKWD